MLRTMLAAGALTTLGALPVFLVSAQSVLIREDLHFSEPQLGLAVSAFFAAAAVTTVTAGSLAERYGRRASTIVAGVLTLASGAGIALAASTYTALLALLVLAGLANAALQMTANVALTRTIPPGRQGLAFGIKQSAVQVSILIGGVAVPTVGVLLGWRWTFGAMAAAGVLVALAGLRVRRPLERSADSSVARDRPPVGALVVSFAAMALASAAVNSLGAFLPAWAFINGLSPGDAGLLLAAASGLSVIARILVGVAADRRRGRNFPVVAAQLLGGAIGFWMLAAGLLPLVLVGALLAFGIGWAWPGLMLFAVARVGRDSPATATGAIQAGAFSGGASGPVLFGLLVAGTSYPFAWSLGGVVLLCAALLLLVARRMFVTDLARRPPRRPLDASSEPAD